MIKVLEWAVFQAAVCYGRNKWRTKCTTPEARGEHDRHWDLVWAIQREMGHPPTGLIRSC